MLRAVLKESKKKNSSWAFTKNRFNNNIRKYGKIKNHKRIVLFELNLRTIAKYER